MTKLRAPLSIEDAITTAFAALRSDGVEKATGKSASLVRQWADPDNETHHAPLYQCIRMDEACIAAGEQPPIFQAYKARIESAASAASHDALHPMERLGQLMGELGDVADELRAAIGTTGDGGRTITPREAQRILAEAAELKAAVEKLEKDVLVEMEAGRVTPMRRPA